MTGANLPERSEGYAVALAASDGLRAALAGLGVPERSYRSIQPATTSTGSPYVYLGILNACAVEALTAALRHELAIASRPKDQDADVAVRLDERSRLT